MIAGDGSFCNRTVLATIPERTTLIARARKDAKLCFARSRRNAAAFTAKDKFTPEQVAPGRNDSLENHKIFYGGKRRKIRYKEVPQVLWQSGAKTRPLRLFVIAPTPYRKRKSAKSVLSPARLSAMHRTDQFGPATASDLL